HVGDVSLHVAGPGAGRGQLGDDLLAVLSVASGDDQGGALPGGGPGDAGTQPLGAPSDQDDLAGEEVLHRVPPVEAVTRQRGLATAEGSRPSRTSTTPVAAAVKVAAVAWRLRPMRCGVGTASGWSTRAGGVW